MRWDEPRDPDRSLPPRRWGVAVAGLGVALVAGATILAESPPPPSRGVAVAAETVDEPTGRGGLPHRVPSALTTTAPAPAPVVVEPLAEVVATTGATTPPSAPLVARAGHACDVPAATAVSGDGEALVCQGGKGNGVPRWRRA